ncbi:MAG TPA: quinone oxidoreductase [Sandaracinaceae bacterium LLY-WYZ-13_1]|nr:quinone oxidoreductase [Sandaracinaceae bacterium LLY-WYZ-13_1]
MTQAIRFHAHGGPEVLRLDDVEVGEPGPGEAVVRHTAVGLNFIDTYHRTGLYPVELPSGLGMEAAGVIEALGEGVDELSVGSRVAYAGGPPGAYAEARRVPADRLVPLPDGIDDETAAAAMLKGLTVEYLIRRTHAVQPGEVVLWHAAAGGVGLIAMQWLKHLGATVIGTVGSDDKASRAKAAGCDHAIVYTREDFVARVREITGGEGLPVVYDSVGRATFEGSLDCLRPRGLMVSFGNASGKPEPLDVVTLAQKGSLYLTRPSLMTYAAERADLLDGARALLDVLASGAVEVTIGQRFALADAADAHRALEARETTGSTVLTV